MGQKFGVILWKWPNGFVDVLYIDMVFCVIWFILNALIGKRIVTKSIMKNILYKINIFQALFFYGISELHSTLYLLPRKYRLTICEK